jgi:hypothetical protein
MLLKNNILKINVPLKWSIDFDRCNDKMVIIKNKLTQNILSKMGKDYLIGHIQCIISGCGDFENTIEDQISLYLNNKQNLDYNIEISPNEVIEIAGIYTIVTNFKNI